MAATGRLSVWLAAFVAFAAGAVGSDQGNEVNHLIEGLGQRGWRDAVDALAEIGEPAVEPLIRILKDKSTRTWTIQARAINVLAKIGTERAVGAIIDSLKDTDSSEYVRAAAVRALGEIKSEEAVDDLVRAFADEHWLVRLNSRNALLEIGGPATERLIEALDDRNPGVRWQAAWVLGRIKSENALAPLVKALEDSYWMVRDEAAVAIVRIDSEKAVGLLASAVRHRDGHVREQAKWVMAEMKRDKTATEHRHVPPNETAPDQISYDGKTYSCYPKMLDSRPNVPSPCTARDGAEILTALMKDGKYALMPVTVENGEPLNYKERQWGKGRQLEVDAADFPTLARTGLHSEEELNRAKTIAGRSAVEITELGRPGRSSGAGFMASDEDIVSVLRGDDQLVRELGLKHPQMARPLFHVWNMMLRDYKLGRLARFWDHIEYISYNGTKVFLKGEGTRGWQESLFEDEILGMYQFEVWRELSRSERAFLEEKYPHLSDEQMADFVKRLTRIHTGEMVPYYIMRYGFYEGHTDYRADPIAIAFIFGLKSLEQIEAAFEGRLYEALTQHFIRDS
ncbi:MAG: HEAT repeat domain-containing protein [Planctomycetota bacterium]|jgi:hypothetical protein